MQILNTIEQSLARAQQNGHNVQLHLVHQAGIEILLGDVGSARQSDVFSLRGAPGQIVGLLDAFSDEGEHRAALQLERRAGMSRHHEYWMMEWRARSPPSL